MTLLPEVSADEIPPAVPGAGAEEADLVRAAAAGDAQAFAQLVRRQSGRVFNFIHQMTRHRQDAEDLTQQTFLKVHRHLGRFDPGRPLINWLFVIARRTVLNHFRSAPLWEQVPEGTASPGPSPAAAAEGRDEAEDLWEQARAALPQRDFEVLWLRFGEELSTKETARIVGLTETHVKVLVHRARQVLTKKRPRS